ncbi:MAG: hypothetical protein H8E15_02405, partial [Planctomycetes bacterium]|nr:hypothetical protein [Planctomycetota bacterium]
GANYYFPVSAEEISAKLKDLPSGDQDGITHIWLRRPSGKEARRGHGLGEFICGRGVHLITLYPWRKDRRRCLGRNRLTGKEGNGFKRFGGRIYKQRGWWYVEFSEPDLKRYFLDTFFDVFRLLVEPIHNEVRQGYKGDGSE